jgi:hypothetical protein
MIECPTLPAILPGMANRKTPDKPAKTTRPARAKSTKAKRPPSRDNYVYVYITRKQAAYLAPVCGEDSTDERYRKRGMSYMVQLAVDLLIAKLRAERGD